MLGNIVTIETKRAVEVLAEVLGIAVSIFGFYIFFAKRNKNRFDKKADKEAVKISLDAVIKDIETMKREIDQRFTDFKETNFQSHVDMRNKINENCENNSSEHKILKSDQEKSFDHLMEFISSEFGQLSTRISDLRADLRTNLAK
jgi:hypothetical protein